MKSIIHRDGLLTIAGLAGLAALFLFVVYLPGRKEFARIDAEIAAANGEIADVPQRVAELGRLRSEIARREEYLQETLRHVPSSGDVHGVVQEVARIARQADLKLTRLEPLTPAPQAAYQVVPFRVGFSGRFERIAEFLRGLESRERLIAVQELALSQEARRSGQDVQGTLDFHIYVRNAEFSDSTEKNDRSGRLASDTN
ncbi:MAG: type 4a pilus biogenesis protein PilO [Planctomycetales bacterium]